MDHKLWVGQRFLLNERGLYTVSGSCGTERVQVEIDPSVTFLLSSPVPERGLMDLRTRIQNAARLKWEANEVTIPPPTGSSRVEPSIISLTAEDLGL